MHSPAFGPAVGTFFFADGDGSVMNRLCMPSWLMEGMHADEVAVRDGSTTTRGPQSASSAHGDASLGGRVVLGIAPCGVRVHSA